MTIPSEPSNGPSPYTKWLQWLDEIVVSTVGVHLWMTPNTTTREEDSTLSYDDISTKVQRIQLCLAKHPVNLWELRELALSKGGLLESRFRKQAWPLLVGLDNHRPILMEDGDTYTDAGTSIGSALSLCSLPSTPTQSTLSDNSTEPQESMLPQQPTSFAIPSTSMPDLVIESNLVNPSSNHATNADSSEDEKKAETTQEASMDLIRRDAGRSVVFRYYASPAQQQQQSQTTMNVMESESSTNLETPLPNDNNISYPLAPPPYASQRLAQALEHTIRQSSSYHYYQGLHDVAGVILHQLDYEQELATSILQRLSVSHWRDALKENFSSLTWMLNHLLLPLVEQVDPNVHYQLCLANVVELANLTLPWVITWFTHDIFDPTTAGSLVDAFMASHPAFPVYFSVALLTHPLLKQGLLEADPNDPTSIFIFIKNLPKSIAMQTTTASASYDHSDATTTTTLESTFSSDTATPTTTVSVQELLDDSLLLLQRFPPRSLLNLVDDTCISRTEILQNANSIALFKAACSWNLASSLTIPAGSDDVLNPNTTTIAEGNDDDVEDDYSGEMGIAGNYSSALATFPSTAACRHHRHVRAHLASGVPLLMKAVSSSPCLNSSHWGSRQHSSKFQNLKKKRRITLAKFEKTLRRWISGR